MDENEEYLRLLKEFNKLLEGVKTAFFELKFHKDNMQNSHIKMMSCMDEQFYKIVRGFYDDKSEEEYEEDSE